MDATPRFAEDFSAVFSLYGWRGSRRATHMAEYVAFRHLHTWQPSTIRGLSPHLSAALSIHRLRRVRFGSSMELLQTRHLSLERNDFDRHSGNADLHRLCEDGWLLFRCV